MAHCHKYAKFVLVDSLIQWYQEYTLSGMKFDSQTTKFSKFSGYTAYTLECTCIVTLKGGSQYL